ncbi:MAG TPA: hypothetical protein VJZ25_00980 [Gemmatimonadaceae bacterium]|nr:hypothetical protein [Gemmatimonadaceae bacterium]
MVERSAELLLAEGAPSDQLRSFAREAAARLSPKSRERIELSALEAGARELRAALRAERLGAVVCASGLSACDRALARLVLGLFLPRNGDLSASEEMFTTILPSVARRYPDTRPLDRILASELPRSARSEDLVFAVDIASGGQLSDDQIIAEASCALARSSSDARRAEVDWLIDNLRLPAPKSPYWRRVWTEAEAIALRRAGATIGPQPLGTVGLAALVAQAAEMGANREDLPELLATAIIAERGRCGR